MKDSLAKTHKKHMLHAPPLTNRLMESCVMESFFGLHVGIAQNDVYHGVSTNLDMQIFRIPYGDNPAK